ncbi:MAG: hypothetical protein GXP28_11670 [Planctomycetes bacterium]|nr:hypothetical protein [Planctomycetota bacterium]
MFRDRPLTWLFVIATICVDLTQIIDGSVEAAPLWFRGFELGQIAVLAIWAVRGRIHRLLRASCLVLVTSFLGCFSYATPLVMGLFSIYAFAIYVVTLVVYVYRGRRDQEEKSAAKKPFQVPLIEFFGLTIVVAIAAYFVRVVDFVGVWKLVSFWEWTIMLAIPCSFVASTRNDLRDIGRGRACVIVVVAIAAGWSVSDKLFMIVVQMAYIVAWMVVLGLDNVISEAASLRTVSDANAQATEPKLFNPQD